MKPLLDSRIDGRIQELSQRLSDYRKKRGAGCRPSREIWDKAIALCEQAPLVRVADGIGVSSNGLRNRKKAERRLANNVIAPRQPQFLEVRGLIWIGILKPVF